MKFWVNTIPGLEEVSKQEIEKLGGKILSLRHGKIILEGNESLIMKLNYLGRTFERVVWMLKECEVKNLEEIYKEVKEIDFGFIKGTFAVKPLRIGNHNFTSIDIGRVAGKAVVDSYYDAKKTRLKVNLDNPDVVIRTELIENKLYVGVDLSGESLHKRGYRKYQHPAPLNPCIASSLIYISKWNKEEVLDPLCGSGTILIECVMIGRNIPPGKLRKFAFEKIFDLDFESFKKTIKENKEKFNLIGIEKFKKHIEGAKLNASVIGVVDTIKFIQGDITKMHLESDIVITNPPFGLRIGSKKILKGIYKSLLKINCKKLVLITSEKDLLFNLISNSNFEIEKIYNVKYGDLDTVVIKLIS